MAAAAVDDAWDLEEVDDDDDDDGLCEVVVVLEEDVVAVVLPPDTMVAVVGWKNGGVREQGEQEVRMSESWC